MGLDAIEAWGEMDVDCATEEPVNLAQSLARLHRLLIGKARVSRARAASHYTEALQETKYEPGDRVVLWSSEIAALQGNKIGKPWIGPYVFMAPLGRVGYELTSEVGGGVGRVHANRLRKIEPGVVETGDPRNGFFSESLRTLGEVKGAKLKYCPRTGISERMFHVQVGGRRSKRWTKESDLQDVVVRLYDKKMRDVDSGSSTDGADAKMEDTGNIGSTTQAHDDAFGSDSPTSDDEPV